MQQQQHVAMRTATAHFQSLKKFSGGTLITRAYVAVMSARAAPVLFSRRRKGRDEQDERFVEQKELI